MLKAKLEELKNKDIHWKIKQELFDFSGGLRDISKILWIFNLRFNVTTDEKNLLETIEKLNNHFQLEEKGFFLDGENKNTIKLENGNYMFFDFGKYKSNITFIIPNLDNKVEFKKDEQLAQQLNLLYTGDIKFIKGKFFISKKGKPMFDLTGDTPHVICKISWGGAFCKSRGLKHIPKNMYYRRAISNGGGMGNDYLVIPANHTEKFNIDDF